jgi:hypothetical protein
MEINAKELVYMLLTISPFMNPKEEKFVKVYSKFIDLKITNN